MIFNEGGRASLTLQTKEPTRDATTGEVTGYVLSDPATVSVKVTDPDAVETTYAYLTDAELTKFNTGVYILDIPVPLPGQWKALVTTTGPGPVLNDELWFTVVENESWTTIPPFGDYQEFLGENEATQYAGEALAQATDLILLGTGLTGMPTTAQDARIYSWAIFSMAEALEAYKAVRAISSSPFTEEDIGSYSYVRASSRIATGLPTGLLWVDIAIAHFMNSGANAVPWSDSIQVFEADNVGTFAESGDRIVLGPRDWGLAGVDRYTLLATYGINV